MSSTCPPVFFTVSFHIPLHPDGAVRHALLLLPSMVLCSSVLVGCEGCLGGAVNLTTRRASWSRRPCSRRDTPGASGGVVAVIDTGSTPSAAARPSASPRSASPGPPDWRTGEEATERICTEEESPPEMGV